MPGSPPRSPGSPPPCPWVPSRPGPPLADDDWQEAHERLAELEDKAVASGERDGPGGEEPDLLGEPEDTLAERLTRLVIDSELEDPAIMQAVQTRGPTQVREEPEAGEGPEVGSPAPC